MDESFVPFNTLTPSNRSSTALNLIVGLKLNTASASFSKVTVPEPADAELSFPERSAHVVTVPPSTTVFVPLSADNHNSSVFATPPGATNVAAKVK